jgi:quinol monooxygenase YgiN
MIAVSVTWKAKPGHEGDVARLFVEMGTESRREPGCLMYVVHRHQTEPGRFLIYEQYKDRQALEAHRASPHFAKYVKEELPRFGERVEGSLYDPLE